MNKLVKQAVNLIFSAKPEQLKLLDKSSRLSSFKSVIQKAEKKLQQLGVISLPDDSGTGEVTWKVIPIHDDVHGDGFRIETGTIDAYASTELEIYEDGFATGDSDYPGIGFESSNALPKDLEANLEEFIETWRESMEEEEEETPEEA